MSEISEGDRDDSSQPVGGPADDLATAMSPELSPVAGGAGADADPADAADQQADAPVTEGVLDDAEAAESHPE